MKKLFFFLLSALSVFSVGAHRGCDTKNYNELCMSQSIDHCYSCKSVEDYIPTICVPVFKDNLGTLENYSRDDWNCTLYSPTLNTNKESNNYLKDLCYVQPFFQTICEFTNDKTMCYSSKLLTDFCSGHADLKEQICDVDEALYNMCNQTDHDGICMTASIIHYYCIQDYEGLKTELCKVEDYAYDMCTDKDQNAFCSIVFKLKNLCHTDKRQNYFHSAEFELPTSHCFSQKIRCMVNPKCRQLVDRMFECGDDETCMIRDVDNTDFLRLMSCMFAQH